MPESQRQPTRSRQIGRDSRLVLRIASRVNHTTQMARKRAHSYGEKQRRILQVAAEVVAELGMEKASMAQIALRGGMSKALLYHYYASKSALIFDIVRTHLAELDDALDAVDDPAAEPVERLRRLVHQVLECYRHADNQHKVQLNCSRMLTRVQLDAVYEIERNITHRFSAVLALVNPDLAGANNRLMPVTMSLFGMLNWVYMWFRPDGPMSREAYADLLTSLIVNGIQGLD